MAGYRLDACIPAHSQSRDCSSGTECPLIALALVVTHSEGIPPISGAVHPRFWGAIVECSGESPERDNLRAKPLGSNGSYVYLSVLT